MKILAFGTSNYKNSINQQLALYAASLFTEATIDTLDLNDFEMPIFSLEREGKNGVPEHAHQFLQKIANADVLVISLSEHNGTYSAAFKNIFDWASLITGKVFQDKPLLLLATSNGARGGIAVLNSAIDRWKYMGGNIKASFSLPEFEKNFDTTLGITSKELKDKLLEAVERTQQEAVLG